MTAELAAILQAPFVRRRIVTRVESLVERYDALLGAGRTARVSVPVLFRYPSALRERDAVGRTVLQRRREAAAAEVRALRAAAPVPAPVDRPDRRLMQALGEAQWLARELRALRRAAHDQSTAAVDQYVEFDRQDPLPEPETILPTLLTLPRGRLVNFAFRVAGLRYGVDGLAEWLVERPAVATDGPVPVGPRDAFEEGRAMRVLVRERPVAVFCDRGQLYAVGALCPHRGGPLDEGTVEDGAVVCPLHDWAFDLQTGQMRGRPTLTVPTYEVEVIDGQVFVTPPEPESE